MNNTIDIQSLGTEYTVMDKLGNVIKLIQIIPHNEILDAALGPYTDEFDSYASYLSKSLSVLSGFDNVDSNHVLWYSTVESEISLTDIIEYAIKYGYDKVILEQLEPLI